MESERQFLLSRIPEPLIAWYLATARQLPWRENRNPYRIWISEIMLQQTRVAAVIPYFLRFMERLPTVQALADAPEEELLKLWEGLGYYSRARNLQNAARVICEKFGGVFPTRHEDILSLPGIGPYTAGAIASIAFGQPTPAVDGNVLRVVSRLTAWDADLSKETEKKKITELLSAVYPAGRCGEFTQALMELGATVCAPNSAPDCPVCPLRLLCMAERNGTWDKYPVIPPKKPRRIEKKTVLILRCGERVAVHKRTPGGLLGGLWEFPNAEGHLSPEEVAAWCTERELTAKAITEGTPRKHIFTHIEWHMTCYRVTCPTPAGDFTWATFAQLENEISLPTAFRKFIEEL